MDKIWLKHYPTSIPHEIPPIDKDIVTLFLEACQEFETQPAFRSFDRGLSYGKLKQLSFHLASELQNQGLKTGDKIIIQLPNILQYPVSLWASLLSGLTVVNMNPLYTSREMLHQIKDSGAKAIILLSSSAKKLEEIIDQTDLKTVIITKPGDLLGRLKRPIVNFVFKYIQKKSPSYNLANSLSFLKALARGSQKQPQIFKRDLDETLFIQYTGGTTGTSKGACLSQKNILSNLKQCELWLTPSLERGKERVLSPLPLYHIFSFLVNGLLLFLYGAENILIADPRQFQKLINTMKKYPVSTGVGVNSLFKALLQRPSLRQLDFSKCKFFVAGGMSLEPSVQKQWKELTGVPIIEGYGLTEASPVVCCNSLQNPEEEGHIGFPLPSTEIRIINEQGTEQPIGKEGELEVRGPQVMQGYYQKAQETKNVFQNGWLKTGDIALINEKGLIKIKDRKKDMIIVSGFNVYPNEVEEVINLHEAVRESAVVGKQNASSVNEEVKAFVVKKELSLTEEDLKLHCRKLLAPYKIPKTIEFVENIPKTNIGKPLRRAFKN
ncbi:MAG: AMP-binding protein [Bdellovibrionales bacterium]|nr:AMP-binding protein [Bdellovibrionales bacterium]